jgi:hypothetical protein
MLTKEKLLRHFKESMPIWRKKGTLYRYPRVIESFIDYVGVKEQYTRSDAIRFLNHILNSGLSKNYARWSAYILKQFYESLGIEFPLKSKELPQIEPGDVNAPVFNPEYVKSLVKAVKNKGTPMMRAYLSLSTTFGLRREELASLTNDSFSNQGGFVDDLKKAAGVRDIIIRTVKGGEIRRFVVPDEIRPFVDGYNFHKVHPQTMTNLIKRIQFISGLKHEQGDGWHGIRRSLVTGLMSNGVPPSHVFSFMGWKLTSQFGIMGTYTRPDPKEVEELVYEKHPFLGLWR